MGIRECYIEFPYIRLVAHSSKVYQGEAPNYFRKVNGQYHEGFRNLLGRWGSYQCINHLNYTENSPQLSWEIDFPSITTIPIQKVETPYPQTFVQNYSDYTFRFRPSDNGYYSDGGAGVIYPCVVGAVIVTQLRLTESISVVAAGLLKADRSIYLEGYYEYNTSDDTDIHLFDEPVSIFDPPSSANITFEYSGNQDKVAFNIERLDVLGTTKYTYRLIEDNIVDGDKNLDIFADPYKGIKVKRTITTCGDFYPFFLISFNNSFSNCVEQGIVYSGIGTVDPFHLLNFQIDYFHLQIGNYFANFSTLKKMTPTDIEVLEFIYPPSPWNSAPYVFRKEVSITQTGYGGDREILKIKDESILVDLTPQVIAEE